jgi:hypothetical protein
MGEEVKDCLWSPVNITNSRAGEVSEYDYRTECGKRYSLDNKGGPKGNGFNYCVFCGGRIIS